MQRVKKKALLKILAKFISLINMASKAFIDTSAWIAYYLSDDRHHIKIKNLLKGLIVNKATICTSNDVIDETVTRLIYTTHSRFVKKFIAFISESIKGGNLVQFWVDDQVQLEAFDLSVKFLEHKLSMTDCTTLVLLKRFSIDSLVSMDSDFTKVGVNTLP